MPGKSGKTEENCCTAQSIINLFKYIYTSGTQAQTQTQAQIQANPVAVQQAHQRATQMLNQLARAQGLPTYQEFHAQHGIAYPAPPDPGNLGVANVGFQPTMRSQVQEDQRQIQANLQAAQTPISWQAVPTQEGQYQTENLASQLPIIRPVAQNNMPQSIPQQPATVAQKPLKASIQKTNLDLLAEKAFYDPRDPDKNLLQQTQDKHAVAGSKLEQVELNLARFQAQGKITQFQAQNTLQAMQLATATNWLKCNGQIHPNGTVTYRGMTVPTRIGPLLTYADTQHYLSTDRHLSSRDNWQQIMLTSGQNILEGMAHGVSAGGAFKSKNDLMFAAGDLIGTVGTNIALIAGTGGVGTPAALAFYWSAREANREMQAGKPLNPLAIAGSGVLGAIPGSVVAKSTLGMVGRIGAGATLGYGQDIGTRAVEQLGDTGKNDFRKIDYRPGLGTVIGTLFGTPIRKFQKLEDFLAQNEEKLHSQQRLSVPEHLLDKKQLLEVANHQRNGAESEIANHIISHSVRSGTVFPTLKGKVSEKNMAADKLVRAILEHRQKSITAYYSTRFNAYVIDIKTPIGGLRYNRNGTLRGVLEP